MQILARLAVTLSSALLAACALPGPPPPPTSAELSAIPALLGSGTARLTCKTFECGQTWHAARRNKAMLNLYQLELWPDLAQRVLAANYEWDLAYFYLGRAAEGLGKPDAAVTYYKLAIASKTKCSNYGPAYCDELDVSALTWQALERLVPAEQRPTNPSLGLSLEAAPTGWQRPTIFFALPDVRKDIEQMLSTPLKKNNWETDAEFQSRKIELLAKSRAPRGYRISLPIANPSNNLDQLVYYDLERGLITVALPPSSSQLFSEEVSGKKELRWLHSSFVQTDSIIQEPRTYTASNRLGAVVTITELRKTSYGVAVLNKATEGLRVQYRQTFTQPMEREGSMPFRVERDSLISRPPVRTGEPAGA